MSEIKNEKSDMKIQPHIACFFVLKFRNGTFTRCLRWVPDRLPDDACTKTAKSTTNRICI